ncbi:FecR domain-containing protein [Chitinophaga sedimenti]|uniref:FecR family protein n=1 Tax=Chitinophaga sedimenti TaxID=2033606 RepID=UPI002006A322|nr:FecR family protein [Chitinophaga sedimenti]MCK7557851.1 FecR domain-containing protein [Chitinophaga sedimenti]
MQQDAQYYRQLLQRYTDGTCTPEEASELFSYLESDELTRDLAAHSRDVFNQSMAAAGNVSHQASVRMQERIMERIRPVRKPVLLRRSWFRYAAAAFLLLAAAGAYRWMTPKPAAPQQAIVLDDVAPGSDKAVLTLGDGTRVELDSAAIRNIGAGINQQKGHLKYDVAAERTEPVMNTLTTPKAGQYQLTLPDGSRVWLNAASSITFPTAYNGKERLVTLSGEAYFEIAPGTRPFKVKANGMEVQVLGTSFNVMAYPDEQAGAATLLEGAVKVVAASAQNVLKPGYQALVHYEKGTQTVQAVDLDKVIAWKTGFFEFDNVELPVLMRQIARWYDVEIVYKGSNQTESFGGRISRHVPLSDILRALHVNGVECRIEGRKVIVL